MIKNIKNTSMFVCLFNVIVTCLGFSNPSLLAQQKKGIDMIDSSLAWPSTGACQRIGRLNPAPAFASVDAPRIVIQAASSVLKGNPSLWYVNHIYNYSKQGKEVVCLLDTNDNCMIYLIQSDRWVHLNTTNSLPYINEVLTMMITKQQEMEDPQILVWYIGSLAFIYKGPERVVLSDNFLRVNGPYIDVWLHGKEKSPDVLRSLCKDPRMVQLKDGILVQCNIITNKGAVEYWSVKVRLDTSIEILAVSVNQSFEDGSFSFGLVGSG